MWGFDQHVEETARVQALRATPPGHAADTPERRRVFGAALQQFDELLTAAGTVGAASAPLPLFYALSQAGRAVAAARCPDDRWDFAGHGLRVDENAKDIGTTVVKPDARKGGRDAFSVVADATGSGKLTEPVELGALWASLPALDVAKGLGEGLPRALPIAPEPYRLDAQAGDLRLPSAAVPDWAALDKQLRPYPSARDYKVRDWGEVYVGSQDRTDAVIILEWRGAHDTPRRLRDVCETYLDEMNCYLWPAVGPNGAVLSPLMTWWATLLALSSLARYVPAAWTAALDRDESPLAVPLEAGLRYARRVLPRVVLHAITRSWD